MPTPRSTHDLIDFMVSTTTEMEAEYYRIQKRAAEDPGTAGDEGEENWAELLRNWLPQGYHVTTKGRILSQKNIASKQVDVIVLKPTYPRHLLEKKMYLAGGVAAAFECKLSIKVSHIKKSFSTMKGVLDPRVGSVYEELHSSIIYGVLSHSHSWKTPKSRPVDIITNVLRECQKNVISHPREEIDLICVADLGTWTASKLSVWGRSYTALGFGLEGFTDAVYMCASKLDPQQKPVFTPIGSMIAYLWRRLGFEDAAIRALAEYFWYTTGPGGGSFASGRSQRWMNTAIFSEKTLDRMRNGARDADGWWDYWRQTFA